MREFFACITANPDRAHVTPTPDLPKRTKGFLSPVDPQPLLCSL